MKSASGALIALLNSSVQFKMADLLLISNIGALAESMPLCSADFNISDGINTYLPGPLKFTRSRTSMSIGLEVDELVVTLMGQHTYGGIPFQQAVCNGVLDGSRVTLQRAFMAEWGNTAPGFLWQFSGRASDVEPFRNKIIVKFKNDNELLDSQFPRNLYQPGCTNTLFDAGCGVVKATYTTSGIAVSGGSTKTAIYCTNAQASGFFDLGTIQFTTGPNAGAKRTVKKFTMGAPALFELSLPLPFTPTVGDLFAAVPGCDKSKGANGCPKFSNDGRFRGCRFIPRPETIR